jgi:hypothetical protein
MDYRLHDVRTVWEVIDDLQKHPELSHLKSGRVEKEMLAFWNADQRMEHYFISKTECKEVIEDIKRQFIKDILLEEY